MNGPATGDQPVFDALAATFLALAEITLGNPTRPGVFGREPDCAWAWAPVALPDVNRVVAPRLSGRPAAVEARIEAINAHFGALPFTWWLDPAATPADLVAALGWVAPGTRREWVPVMALDLAAPDGVGGGHAFRASPGVAVALAEGSAELAAAERLSAHGFGAGDEDAEPFASMFEGVTAGPDGPLIVTVASLEGRPAATALGIVAGDRLGIYNVATLPDARRRGLGRAAMARALVEGRRRGARTAVLESSLEGVGLYRALGFREAGRALVVTVPGGG